MAVVLLQLLFFIAKRHHIYFTTTYFLNTRLIYKNIYMYILRIHYIHMIAHIQVLFNDTRPCTCIPYIRNVCDDLHVNVWMYVMIYIHYMYVMIYKTLIYHQVNSKG